MDQTTADSVTAVDAAPEMLAIAADRVGDERVRFIAGDVFNWKPDRRYNVVFFGLSHVPLERFDSFWSLVGQCLEPEGRVLFFDDAYRTPGELIEGEASSTICRRLRDGSAYRASRLGGDLAHVRTSRKGRAYVILKSIRCILCHGI